jgi:hypothetical protein
MTSLDVGYSLLVQVGSRSARRDHERSAISVCSGIESRKFNRCETGPIIQNV